MRAVRPRRSFTSSHACSCRRTRPCSSSWMTCLTSRPLRVVSCHPFVVVNSILMLDLMNFHWCAVSFSVVMQGANSLVSGLVQIEKEVDVLKRLPDPPPGDRFVPTMEVSRRRQCFLLLS